MPTGDITSAKPDVQTPNVDGLDGQKIDELNNDARTAPTAPKMSGNVQAEPNPLSSHPDLRDAGQPDEPMETSEPRSGR